MTSMCLFGTLYALLPAVFVVLFRGCLSVKTSKACYGIPGFPCTKHTLECSRGLISIQDAYYTNSTDCTRSGLPSCYTIVNTIQDTGRYQNFSEIQWKHLKNSCSTKSKCIFPGVWTSATATFSILKYNCVKTTPSTTDSISTVNSPITSETVDMSHLSSSSVPSTLTTSDDTPHLSPSSVPPTTSVSSTVVPNFPQMKTQKKPGTGTVIAVVIPCLLIIAAIVLLAVFIIRRKTAKTTKKDDKTNPNTKSQKEYSLARDVHQNEYFEIEKSPAKMAKTDYDNAGFVDTTGNASSKNHEVYTLAGVAHSNEYFEIEPTAPKNSLMAYDYAELSNTHTSTSQNEENVGPTNIQVQEDDYDHAGGKPVIQNGHYDTTASVAKTLSKSNSTDIKGDVYSYDHLKDKSTTDNANNDYDVAGCSSDYDTTASVQKRFDHATECREDDYGYNHLGNQVQKKTLHNDYDTSASAVTAVARLNSRTDEPEYDHVTQDTGVDSVPSSEDDSDVYTLARKGDNPYQLAK